MSSRDPASPKFSLSLTGFDQFSGNPEDENVNFFLTVAELQKINEAMRQQVRLTEKNLQSTNQEIEGKSLPSTVRI